LVLISHAQGRRQRGNFRRSAAAAESRTQPAGGVRDVVNFGDVLGMPWFGEVPSP
jgi:hypothetical protein